MKMTILTMWTLKKQNAGSNIEKLWKYAINVIFKN